MSLESRGPEVYGDGRERQVAGRLGAVGACICPEGLKVCPYVQIGTGPPHAAVVLLLSATDAKRSIEPASGAVCGGGGRGGGGGANPDGAGLNNEGLAA